MLRRLLGTGPESTPNGRAQEAAVAEAPLERAVWRSTVAEPVPDADTLEMLAADGVGLAQGFHIGHPRPVSELP
jgi:EAL domain-containing protein (putative c-di-GMP-specific phosphodiesterase class I)